MIREAEEAKTKFCDAKPANDSDHEQSNNQCDDSLKEFEAAEAALKTSWANRNRAITKYNEA